MALEIRKAQSTPAGLVADRRLFLTRDGGNIDARPGQQVVEEEDPAAAFLLATPGTIILAEDVARLRLELVDGRVVQAPAVPTMPPTASGTRAGPAKESTDEKPKEPAEEKPSTKKGT